jgi:hypothetical protein
LTRAAPLRRREFVSIHSDFYWATRVLLGGPPFSAADQGDLMNELSEIDSPVEKKLRCIQQIAEADEETLQIVSAVLDRARPLTKPQGRKRGRPAGTETDKGGAV